MTSAEPQSVARRNIEYDIRAEAQLLRAVADVADRAAGTDPLVLLSSCDNIRTLAAKIQVLAQRLRNFTK